jgi:hypothetical protein
MASTDLARLRGSWLALHKRGAKMSLRHGMEGGPTTGRVLAGLNRAAARTGLEDPMNERLPSECDWRG